MTTKVKFKTTFNNMLIYEWSPRSNKHDDLLTTIWWRKFEDIIKLLKLKLKKNYYMNTSQSFYSFSI